MKLVTYWADEFDWPAQEATLNRIPGFRIDLGGLGTHYKHVRATVAAPPSGPTVPVLPLVLSYGWPDSFWRYSKVIALLTDPGAHGGDPADAFDVVVPDRHFAPFEEPELYAQELREFFRPYRMAAAD